MRSLAIAAVALVIGFAVVWLLMKMSRSDAADLRLTYLGLAFGAALLALLTGISRVRGRGRDR